MTPEQNEAAFKAYLQECDECAIVPDVAGAFNAGARASLAQPASVPAGDPWALSTAGRLGGTDCRRERESGFFSPCGKRGALWEPAADRATGAQP